MTPEIEAYDDATDRLIAAERDYRDALREYLAARRDGLVTLGGGTDRERCDRVLVTLAYEDATRRVQAAQAAHQLAYRAALAAAVGYSEAE